MLKSTKRQRRLKVIDPFQPLPSSSEQYSDKHTVRSARSQASVEFSGKLQAQAPENQGYKMSWKKKNLSNFKYTQLHGSVSMFTCSLDLGDALTVAEA